MLPSTRHRALLGLFVLGVAVVAGLVVSPAAAFAAVDAIAADPVVFGLVVAGLYLVRPLLAWPTTPLAAVVGYGYGVVPGVPIALAGVVVTVIPVFVAVRWVAGAPPHAEGHSVPLGGVLGRARRAVDAYYETTGPIRGVVASRLAPIPSDVSTCAAAVSGVSLRHLVVGTVVGELPWTVAAVVVGASAATIGADGLGAIGPLFAAGCLLAAAIVLARPLYGVATNGSRRTGRGERAATNGSRRTDRDDRVATEFRE